jgi:Holliday junction resolvase-like predicted endonuclease
MAPLKRKGDLAELNVTADLLDRGCRLSFPYGEDCDYDLIADKNGILHRVQVKYTESDGNVVSIRCSSHSLTNGKVRTTKRYTAKIIDWIAVYDRTSECCYYFPASELGSGRRHLHLRLTPARNGQHIGIRRAADYLNPELSKDPRSKRMEPAGLEPATSAMQAPRSSS